jgi:hypothetical protein
MYPVGTYGTRTRHSRATTYYSKQWIALPRIERETARSVTPERTELKPLEHTPANVLLHLGHVTTKIFEHLSVRDLARCGRVSKTFPPFPHP